MGWSTVLVSILGLVLSFGANPTSARRVLFNNTEPRYDIHGQIIDAHDGSIQVSAGRWVWCLG
eukprot:m.55724 g.55724  ORF g.55724 m.55724 type:complete len:63 (-) comp11984_c0_seq4:142-330(-)